MKKITLILSLALAATTGLKAQKSSLAYNEGDKLLNIGVGVNSYYSGGIPLSASFELGITDAISVGGNIDYLSKTYNGANEKFTAVYFGGRGSYHFNELLNLDIENLDLYAGAGLGFRTFRWSNSNYSYSYGPYGNGLYLSLFAGGKYYFAPNVGGFLELGAVGSTNAKLGLAFRF